MSAHPPQRDGTPRARRRRLAAARARLTRLAVRFARRRDPRQPRTRRDHAVAAHARAEQHRRERAFLDAVMANNADLVLVVGRDRRVSYASPSCARLLGMDATGAPHEALVERVHPDERRATLAALDERLTAAGGAAVRLTARLVATDGRELDVELTAEDRRADPAVGGVVLTLHETTVQAQLATELRRLAYHDPLTGLPNRELFNDRLAQALHRARRNGRRMSVLLCDLDDFKDVNDTLGHPAGDTLLRVLAQRFEGCLRGTDTVARVGGDEFAVVCEDVGASQDAVMAARRLLAAADEPVVIEGHELRVGMSVGVAVDTGERDVDELLRDADIALYDAKREGKRRWSLHRAAMTTRARSRLELAADLARAVAEDEVEIAFQPIVQLSDGRAVGVEALARWRHPVRGPVPPDEFIPVAEHSGLIMELGDRVLQRSLNGLAELRADRHGRQLRLGVNVSPRQLREPKLVDQVITRLAAAELPPDVLVLELTESVMLDDAQQALKVMAALREQGVRFAIDDFGTGYSSLAYLSQLPVDIIKIDRGFVRTMAVDRAQHDLVRAVIEIGRSLELDVLAEGVETAAQRDELVGLGCAFGQGYLFGPGLPLAQLRDWLREANRVTSLERHTRTG